MAVEARIRELGVRHQHLERAIEDELRRPASDTFRLSELKRQKLRLNGCGRKKLRQRKRQVYAT